jgi:hypothetical protein
MSTCNDPSCSLCNPLGLNPSGADRKAALEILLTRELQPKDYKAITATQAQKIEEAKKAELERHLAARKGKTRTRKQAQQNRNKAQRKARKKNRG